MTWITRNRDRSHGWGALGCINAGFLPGWRAHCTGRSDYWVMYIAPVAVIMHRWTATRVYTWIGFPTHRRQQLTCCGRAMYDECSIHKRQIWLLCCEVVVNWQSLNHLLSLTNDNGDNHGSVVYFYINSNCQINKNNAYRTCSQKTYRLLHQHINKCHNKCTT